MCYVALGIIFQPRELSSSRWQWSSWPTGFSDQSDRGIRYPRRRRVSNWRSSTVTSESGAIRKL